MVELYRFPEGFVKRSRPADGNLDEVRFVDTLVRDLDRDGTGKIPEGSSVYVRGWALLPSPPAPGRAAFLTVAPDLRFQMLYGKPRPDIANLHDDQSLVPCGFVGIYSLAGLSRGSHDLTVELLDDRGGYHEVAQRRFTIESSRVLLENKTPAAPGAIHVSIDDIATIRDPRAYDGSVLHARIGDVIFIRGWAVDLAAKLALGGVIGIVDDVTHVVGVHGLTRSDAASAVDAPNARRCGFTVRISTRHMKAGRHRLALAIVAADGIGYLSHPVAPFELTPP